MSSSCNIGKTITERILGRNEYISLRQFFIDSWGCMEQAHEPCVYRVYLAQKGLNLNELFWQEEHDRLLEIDPAAAKALEKTRNTTFYSQSGILTKACELVQSYVKSGCSRFPQILVFDEFAHTGKDFAELFYSLENAIIYAWGEVSAQHETVAEEQVCSAFSSAIEFHPFYSNADGLLIEAPIEGRVYPKKEVPAYEWFPYIQRISKAITLSPGIENTAFIPTFYLETSDSFNLFANLDKSPDWYRSNWDYLDTKTTIWHKDFLGNNGSVRYHYAVRSYLDYDINKFCVTPYVLWDTVSEDAINKLWACLAKCQELSYFSRVFSDDSPVLKTVKLRLLSSITSILLFFDWLRESGFSSQVDWQAAMRSDVEKIAQSFGCIEDSQNDFSTIFANEDVRKALNNGIFKFLFSEAPIMDYDVEPADTRRKSDYLSLAEAFYYNIEQEETEILQLRRRERIHYIPSSTFINKFDGGLRHYLESFPSDYKSFKNKISALLILMQHGYAGQRVYSPQNHTFYLNVGESTHSLAFNSMYRFLPALVRIEKFCLQKKLDTVRCAGLFGRFLARQGETDLEEVFSTFVRNVYKAGYLLCYWPMNSLFWLSKPIPEENVRPVQEWDEKPWPLSDQLEFQSLSKTGYIVWESEKQRYYYDKVAECFPE